MDIDPGGALGVLENSLGALGALIMSYSFSVIGAVILMIVGYFASRLVQRGIYTGLGKIHGFDTTLRQFFANVARYAVLALVLVMVLGQFGVQTASIIAAIGAIGLAIGLALQGTLQNIAAGIMLLVLRPFRVGEDVEIGAVAGKVEDIGLFATRFRHADGIYILAPNSTLWNQPVRNYTRNPVRRADIVLTLPLDADVEHARSSLVDMARNDPRVRRDPPPAALVTGLGKEDVAVTLRYWTAAAEFFATKVELNRRARDLVAPPPAAQAAE